MAHYQHRGLSQPLAIILLTVVALVALAYPPATPTALALPSDGGLRIEPIAAYNFVVDSNVLSPSTYAPEAGTLAARVCNDGAAPITNVQVFIGNRAANTPGVYPSRAHPGLQGAYALTHEGGSAGIRDAARFIPSIAPGQCAIQYWLVSYPRTGPSDGTIVGSAGQTVAVTLNIKPDDDLYLFYDMWASGTEGGVTRNVDATRRVTMRNEISAAANKIWPNTTAKVPQAYLDAIATVVGWDTFTPSGGTVAYPGQTVTTQGIWYDLGNVGFGFDNNGDGVPDQNAWVQPIGDPGSYDPGCFRLVRSFGVLVIKLKGGGEQLVPFVDQLYFENIPENTGVVGLVYYQFAALDGACTAGVTPYQEVASGYDNEKFSGDYGFGVPPLQSREPAVALNKAVSATSILAPPTVTALNYTITFQNTASEPAQFAVSVGDPALGIPLVINDAIPAGSDYVASSATAVGAAVSPAGVRVAQIRYSTDNGATWTTTQPPAASVTNLQWWMDRPVPQGDTITLGFSATAPTAPPAVSTISVIPNTATSSFGTAPPFAEATVRTFVQGPNSVSGNVFRDSGPGALFGNSLYDSASGETLIPNVTVSLYYDADGDGAIDPDEPVVSATAATYTGAYSFGSLADGNYIVQINTADPDLPAGWTNTTRTLRTAALDPTGTGGATPATVAGLNFGYAPALVLDKQLATPTSPVYEGELITFDLDVTNRLPGSGTAAPACSYVIPASIAFQTTNPGDGVPDGGGPSNAQWDNPSNALGLPDGAFAGTDMNNTPDLLGLSGFNLGNQGGTITGVQYRITVRERVEMRGSDYMEIQIYYNNSALGAAIQYNGAVAPFNGGAAGSVYTFNTDITAARSWSWADFANNLTEMEVNGTSGGGNPAGELDLDAAAFVVTTSQTCGGDDTIISTVPLTDTYDADLLQFVSASPPPDSAATTGTAPNTAGTLTWNNVGPLYPSQVKTIQATFRVLAPGADGVVTTNFAGVTGARFRNGRPANNAYDSVPITINRDASISGRVFGDVAPSGWTTGTGDGAGDFGLPGVTVELYGCVNVVSGLLYTTNGVNGTPTAATNADCDSQAAGTSFWRLIASATTDSGGNYSFTGLRPGFYVVQVADGSPDPLLPGGVATSTLPGGPQTAEAADNQAANAGFTCGTCDGVWGFTASSGSDGDLVAGDFNPIDTSNEAISNVDFGYNTGILLYGNVWQDDNGNGARATTEGGLAGVTVTLTNCGPDNNCDTTGDNSSVTDTTDANGNYAFSGLTSGRNYQVTVNTATLPGGAAGWSETAESDGSINNQIRPLSITAGSSGPHDFGFTRTGSFSIGDTLFFDWDADGVQDPGDEGIPGVDVLLYADEDGDGQIDAATDTLLATQATSASGTYSFANRASGSYIVVVSTADAQFPAFVSQTGDPDESGACTVCDSRSTEAVAGASITTADFGYRPVGPRSIGDTVWYDANGDGAQSGAQELGLPNVTVSLQADLNGDGTFVTVRTAVTDAQGKYLFGGLPDNRTYRVVVDAADPDIPNDAFGSNYAATTPTTRAVALSGADVLSADFGFTALAAIGDTVYADVNNNGQQDFGEPGIAGVTVNLANADPFTAPDGTFYAAGAFTRTALTDAGGKYLFSGLPAIPSAGSGVRYTVAVQTGPGSPVSGRPQTADPDRDGENCASTLYPSLTACDNATTQRLYPGSSFTGADFGYLPTGVLGDTLWIDADADGVRDSNEYGIPYVTVSITGPGCAPCATTTDANGEYRFAGLADGAYTIAVDAADPDLTRFTADGLVATYDPDGAPNGSTTAVMSGGVLTTVGGAACAGPAGSCDMNVDFGYRYFNVAGLAVSGTVCLDGAVTAGACGATAGTTSGVDAAGGELAYANETIWLYRWSDDGDGVLESGEAVLAGVTATAANGDYSFSGLPVTSGNDRYIVSLAAPGPNLDMTTPLAAWPADPTLRETTSGAATVAAYRAFTLTASRTNQDFAFQSSVSLDFGDLPTSYSTTLDGTPDGARHIISGSLFLGGIPDAESNGIPTANATGDGADENGVSIPVARWSNGAGGATVSVAVTGTGWLVAWADWDGDGQFADANELVISRAVGTGTASYQFNVPAGFFPGGTGTPIGLEMRFRLFGSQPAIAATAFSGEGGPGEVEDYVFNFTPNPVTLASFTASRAGDAVRLAWSTASEIDVAGFHILRSATGERADAVRITAALIPASGDGLTGGSYRFDDTGAAPGVAASYWLEAVASDGSAEEYGPVSPTPAAAQRTSVYLPMVVR